jgi:2-dehydropantoate 2-reductase
VKVAVIGAGGVGCYYGALLARAGHEVHFLLRRDLEAVRRNGLQIRSHLGDFAIPDAIPAASPDEIGPADLVICALKTTALPDARSLLEPCTGRQTQLLVLMNGFGIEEQFADWFAGRAIFGGMAFVCINRGEPGIVHHLDYGRLTIGHYGDDVEALHALRDVLAAAQMDVVEAPGLRYARWEKLCWNVPFSGIGVAAGGVGTATVLGQPHLRRMAESAIGDVVRAANADLEALGFDTRLDGDAAVTSMFDRTGTMGDYRASMVIDYVCGNALESDAILGAPIRRARELGVEVPTFEAIHAMVLLREAVQRGLVMPYTPANVTAQMAPSH